MRTIKDVIWYLLRKDAKTIPPPELQLLRMQLQAENDMLDIAALLDSGTIVCYTFIATLTTLSEQFAFTPSRDNMPRVYSLYLFFCVLTYYS
jgi:hypothetical protein